MSDVRPHDYPELAHLFTIYFNQDFFATYGSVDGALRAYRTETHPVHRSAARRQLQRLRARTEAGMMAGDLVALGCDVDLTSAAAVAAFVERIERRIV